MLALTPRGMFLSYSFGRMSCDKVLGILFCLVAVTLAHARVDYNPDTRLSVRNAQFLNQNGLFSDDINGCGGEITFGDNGVNNITINTTVTILFNYGIGPIGDHAFSGNVFRISVVPLQSTHAETFDLMQDEKYWIAEVPAPAGSLLSGHEATITIPTTCIGNCVLGIHDQRNWGGCHDLTVHDPETNVDDTAAAGTMFVSVFLLGASLALFFF